MAVELATGYVSLVPSAKGFKSKLNSELRGVGTQAGTQIGDDIGRGLESKIGSVLKSVGALAIKTGAVIAAAGAGLGAWGLKSAADLQQTAIAFEGIFGSATQANDFIEQLRKFAARTPFEFPELAKASQQLLATGFAAETVIPTMTKIGNVAATLGVQSEGINQVVRALGQMQGRGKIASQELIQISEALPGFSAISAIAEHFGITTAEAFKKVEDGAVPAGEGIEAILEGMAKFKGAAGAMERQALTLTGVLSTFKDTVRDALVKGIAPFLPAVSQAIQTAMPQIGAAVGSLGATFGKLLEAAIPLVEKLLPIVVKIADGVSGLLVRAFDLLAPIIDALAPQFDTLFAALIPLVDTFITELAPIIATLAPAVLELATHFATALLPIIQDLAPVALFLAEIFADLVTAMGDSGATAVIAAVGVWKMTEAVGALGKMVGLGALGPIGLSIGLVAGAVYGLTQAFGDNTVAMNLNLEELKKLNQEQLVHMIRKIQEVSDSLGENNLLHTAFKEVVSADIVEAQRFIDALGAAGVQTDWFTDKLQKEIVKQGEVAQANDRSRATTDALRESVGLMPDGKRIVFDAETTPGFEAVRAQLAEMINSPNFMVGVTPWGGSFATGGQITGPGPMGAPVLIQAHVGETVVTAAETATPSGGINFNGPVTFGDSGVIADLDYWTLTRMAGV